MSKGGPSAAKEDAILDLAATEGWAYVEQPRRAVLQADSESVTLISDLVERLLQRRPETRCEIRSDYSALTPQRVAVGVSHNDQKDHLRAALDTRGCRDVVVETANKLQGLEFEVVFVWHPLSGLAEADEFHLDPGRMCVLLTRHRQACVVIGRAGDREVLDDRLPPPTPAYIWQSVDPVLDGWEVHKAVYAELDRVRFAV